MTHLLDTNICIRLMRGGLAAQVERSSPGDLTISAITWFELVVGMKKSPQPKREETRLRQLLNDVLPLDFDADAAAEAAEIRATLETRGRVIGPYDTLIAGHARVLGLTS